MPKGGVRIGAGRPKGQGKYGEATKAIRVPVTMVDEVRKLAENRNISIPLYNMSVEAGSPLLTDSEDYNMHKLNDILIIDNAEDNFLVKVSGYSMKNAGILPNDLLLVNRKKDARNGDIIVASVDSGTVVKRLSNKNGIIRLISENDDYSDIEDEDQNLHLWGVVTKVIRDC
jgi:DNA polymerase V